MATGTSPGAVCRTLVFRLWASVLKLLIGGAAALILGRPFRGRNLLRSWLFIPWTIPLFAGGILFLWLLRTSGGLNLMLERLGVLPVFWLGSDHPMQSIIFLNVWKGSGEGVSGEEEGEGRPDDCVPRRTGKLPELPRGLEGSVWASGEGRKQKTHGSPLRPP